MVVGSFVACAPPTKPNAPVAAKSVVIASDKGATAAGGDGALGGVSLAEGPRRELADAPAVAEVVLSARWRNPRSTLLAAATELKVTTARVNALSEQLAKQFVKDTLGAEVVDVAKFAPLVDLTSPIDAVIGVEPDSTKPKKYAAMSIGLSSLPRAIAALTKPPVQSSAGYWMLAQRDDFGKSQCGLFEAAGKAPARLVCGRRARDLDALGPYLSTTVARRADGDQDFHLAIQLRGLLDRVGPELTLVARSLPALALSEKIGEPAYDDALLEAATALSDEVGSLVNDLDSFEFDATFEPRTGLRIDGRMQFAGSSSWIVQRLIDGPATGPKVPEIFLHTPADAASAAYGTSGDPAAYEGIARVARGLVEGKLNELKFGTPADRKAIAKLFTVRGEKHLGFMSASGHFGDALSLTTLQDAIGGFVGYYVVGIDGPPEPTIDWLKQLVDVYNRPNVQKWLTSNMGDDAKSLPKITIVPAPKELGPGGLDVRVRLQELEDPMAALAALKGDAAGSSPKSATPAKTSVELDILVARDGKRAFVGFGADRKKLAALLSSMKGRQPGAGSIVARPELETVRTEPHRTAAYVTLTGLLGPFVGLFKFADLAPPDVAGPIQRVGEALKAMPRGGKTPMVTTSDSVGGARPRFTFTSKLERGTLDDLGFLGRVILDEIKKADPNAFGKLSPGGQPSTGKP